MPISLIYITNPDKKTAKKIAQQLLQKKLIACANIFPIHSIYWWQKKVAGDKEFVIIAKSQEKFYQKIKLAVEKIHPYKIPCIIQIKAMANKKYEEWIAGII